MKKNKMFEFVLTSIFGAIILMMALIPNLGFITILPGVSITLVHIPVLVGVFFLGLKSSIALGFFFGLGSFIASMIYGVNVLDLAFRNPLISILPRVLFAIAAYFIVQLFKKIFTSKNGKFIIFGLVSIITVGSLYFGIDGILKQSVYHKYNVLVSDYQIALDAEEKLKDNTLSEEKIKEYEKLVLTDKEKEQALINIDFRLNLSNVNYSKTRKVTIPIVIVLTILLITIYYYVMIVKGSKNAYIPSTIILATLAHTILVLLSISILKPQTFYQSFGNNQSIIATIFIIIIANGFVEALVGSVIGTPIVLAITKRMEDDEE